MKYKKILRDYWEKHYIDKTGNHCGLCGNSGIIDSTKTAKLFSGRNVGGKFYCICPNGRCLNPEDK